MTTTVGSLLGSLSGVILRDSLGVKVMLAFGTAAAFIGMIIVLFAAEKPGKTELNSALQ